jgi:hypothetical protein
MCSGHRKHGSASADQADQREGDEKQAEAGEETHAGNVASFGPAGQRGFVLRGAVLLLPQTPDRTFIFS